MQAVDKLFVWNVERHFDRFYSLMYLSNRKSTNFTVHFCRGSKMTRLTSMFDEISASLQFPVYFGYNWSALDGCIQDLDWLAEGTNLIFLLEPEKILSDEGASERHLFVKKAKTYGRTNRIRLVFCGSPRDVSGGFEIEASDLSIVEDPVPKFDSNKPDDYIGYFRRNFG